MFDSHMVYRLVAVGIGGSLGSMARYGLSLWGGRFDTRLPWGTFAANAIGCLVMGAVMYVVIERSSMVPEWVRLGVAVGLLGGLTTFSTFSYEAMTMLREGYMGSAVFYIVVSLLTGLGTAAIGWYAAQTIAHVV